MHKTRYHFLEETTSTNDEARNPRYEHGDAICAERQTAGRGQRGHTWSSEEGRTLPLGSPGRRRRAGDRLSRTIVGIGVNVNQTRFDPSLPNPSSMRLETGCEYDRQEVLHRLGDCLAARYEQLEKGDREALQADYRRRMYRLGERHRYRYPDGRTVEAVLRGVRPSGELLVELPDGRTEGYLFREIEFVIEGKQTARTDGTGCVLKK